MSRLPAIGFALLMMVMIPPRAIGESQSPASPIELESPRDFQVFQRGGRQTGRIRLKGSVVSTNGALEVRIIGSASARGMPTDWQPVKTTGSVRTFDREIPLPAGGWYQVELRLVDGGKTLGQLAVPHVGIGEVFVVAGQSNSTNYGQPRQKTATGYVAAFDGSRWRLADDPQPGVQDHSTGGSFIPAFGDALYLKYHVPIGIASCGYGGTSVRQWLPKDQIIKRHPTTDAFVKTIAPGRWVCTGQLFDGLMQRINSLGPHGFRAVLWHQGESDAGQARDGYPADRQITGGQYRERLEEIIRATRKRAGWQIPWLVAQATYHSAKEPSDAEFRAAQKAVCDDGFAFLGPDTDALGAAYRNGVHFNGRGLKAHGELWAGKVEAIIGP